MALRLTTALILLALLAVPASGKTPLTPAERETYKKKVAELEPKIKAARERVADLDLKLSMKKEGTPEHNQLKEARAKASDELLELTLDHLEADGRLRRDDSSYRVRPKPRPPVKPLITDDTPATQPAAPVIPATPPKPATRRAVKDGKITLPPASPTTSPRFKTESEIQEIVKDVPAFDRAVSARIAEISQSVARIKALDNASPLEKAELMYELYDAYKEVEELTEMLAKLCADVRNSRSPGSVAQYTALSYVHKKLIDQAKSVAADYAKERAKAAARLSDR